MNTLTSIIPVLCLALCAQGQSETSTWTLCTNDLRLIEAHIDHAGEQEIVTIDEFGIQQLYPLSDLFFAVPTRIQPTQAPVTPVNFTLREPATSSPTKYITLIDGQTIKGRIAEPQNPDTLAYNLYAGIIIKGLATLDLEQILSISDQPNQLPAKNPESDIILTTNNDRLTGFIESIAQTTSITTDTSTVRIDLEQISTITLANIQEHTPGVYITTTDDLYIRANRFQFDFYHQLSLLPDNVSFGLHQSSHSPWLFPANAPAAITVVHSRRRLISLCDTTPVTIEPTGGRDWTPEPTILSDHPNAILSTIDLHAPLRVVYPLPDGATRFACELIAPINTWTDCIATISAISASGKYHELITQRLNSDQSTTALNIALPNETTQLEIRIDPGEHGPIQDRVLVKNPRLLIES